MKLCIPAAEAKGLDSALEPRFPHAVSYVIFDTETRTHHEIDAAACNRAKAERIDAVICSGINRHSLEQLQQHGIAVMGTTAGTVAEAIAQFERGELLDSAPLAACNGGHHHAVQQGCCGGHEHAHAAEEPHECCGGHHHAGDEQHECQGGGHHRARGAGCGCHG